MRYTNTSMHPNRIKGHQPLDTNSWTASTVRVQRFTDAARGEPSPNTDFRMMPR